MIDETGHTFGKGVSTSCAARLRTDHASGVVSV